MAEGFKALRDHRKQQRAEHGVECPRCKQLQPKRNATILMPGQRCRVDGYVDPRPDLFP